MMKNKKGFTLTELLAVIVLLGLLSTAAITGLMSVRRNSNRKLAEKLENTLTQVGDEIYPYESVQESSAFMNAYDGLGENQNIKITLSELRKSGFLKNLVKVDGEYKLVSPANNKETCDGFIIITKVGGAPVSKGYIKCNDLYTTTGFDSVSSVDTPELSE